MTQSHPRLLIGVVSVALLTATAGCAALIGDDPDPKTIADKLDDRHDEIEDIQGTQVMTMERNGETERTVIEIVERPSTASRQEIVETDSEWQSEGDVIVSTSKEMISYDADENTVTAFEVDRDPETSALTSEGLIGEALTDSEIAFEGTDTVADRAVYEITLHDEKADQTTTVWADQEFWYPVKYETTFGNGDQQWETTMRYESITFNEGVDDAVFEFEPPEDATVEEFEPPETQTIESADDVDAATPHEFVEPELPEAFGFEEASVTETGDTDMTSVRYESTDETVLFAITDNTDHESTGEPIEIGETEGTISEFGEQRSVTWDCDGVRYSLSGELDRETLTDSAASVGC